MGKVIGIDLGTTNSVVAIYESKTPSIILTQDGDRILPSVGAFTADGDRLVGNPAKGQLITNPENTVYSVKRLMGKRYSEVAPYLTQFSYEIVEGKDDTLKIEINDQIFSPEEISAMILHQLKEAGEQHIGSGIENAIITVPAYFNDSQRQATKDAGEIAGLNVLRIINEPTAAALAYSLDLKKKAHLVVYDFGGGTIDVSVLEVDNEIIKVLATAGNSNLGGNDLDIMLTDLLVGEFKEEYNIDLSENKLAVQRIRDAAEIAKKELSSLDACEINLPFMADSEDGPLHLLRYISRSEFENLIKDKVDQTIQILDSLLKNTDVLQSQIDEILLVGGSTRIPMVQTRVREFFQKEPNRKINPDEIVAMGAAIQGAITDGESKDMLLLDVTPLSLGVKTYGGTFTRIVNANTTIPTDRGLVFSTAEDNQTEVEINIFQGEREIAEDNKLLGKFTLRDISPATKGSPRIEVKFTININGILTVTAIDLSSKHKKEVVVSQSGLLSDAEIKTIKEDAKKFKDDDIKRKDNITHKTKILNHIYSLEQLLPQLELEEDIRAECRAAIQRANEVLEKEETEKMAETITEMYDLNNRLSALFEAVKEVQSQPEPLPKQTPGKKKKKDDTRPLSFGEIEEEARGIEPTPVEEAPPKKQSDTHPYKIETK